MKTPILLPALVALLSTPAAADEWDDAQVDGEATPFEAAVEPDFASGNGQEVTSGEAETGGDLTEHASPDAEAASVAGQAAEASQDSFVKELEGMPRGLTAFETEEVALQVSGYVQMLVVPYVGDDALIANGDVANKEGFRLRRARLAANAYMGRWVQVFLELNPIESDPDAGAVSQALVTVTPTENTFVSLGATKVPFTRSEITSSVNLLTIDRPLAIRDMVPARRLGGMLGGDFWEGRFSAVAGVFNATEGYELGNRFGGLLYLGRLSLALGGEDGGSALVTLGGGAYYEDGPATERVAGSLDATLNVAGATVTVEGLCDSTTPKDHPVTTGALSGTVQRCGGYGEAGYEFEEFGLQPVARVDGYDDHRDIDDAGDSVSLSVGLNWYFSEYAKAQAFYTERFELSGPEQDNGALVLGVTGVF